MRRRISPALIVGFEITEARYLKRADEIIAGISEADIGA